MIDKLKLALVSFGFLGCSPVAPGTVGTLGGVFVAWLLLGTGESYLWWTLGVCAVLYLVTAPLGRWAENYGSKKDPGIFVVDEVIGYLLTVAWIAPPSWTAMVAAFFVFRLFDIWKPWPASALERLPHGHGILMDDVAAGVMAFGFVMLPCRLLLDQVVWVAS